MAAPTPISSLVHSSTLVTAGVYLFLRFSFIHYFSLINKVLFNFSFLTILIARIVALFIFDLKKIIAISTLRQLGLIIFFFSWGLFDIVFFHLLTHALFKSIIFICAGVIIHFNNDIQDLRFIGGLGFKDLPFTINRLLVSSFALSGIPFMSGFYSKDFIIEIIIIMQFNFILFIFNICLLRITIIYSIRVLFYLLNFDKKLVYNNGGGERKIIRGILTILTVLSLIAGIILLGLLFIGERIYLDIFIIFPILCVLGGFLIFYLCYIIYFIYRSYFNYVRFI